MFLQASLSCPSTPTHFLDFSRRKNPQTFKKTVQWLRNSKNDQRRTVAEYEPMSRAALSRALWEIHAHMVGELHLSTYQSG